MRPDDCKTPAAWSVFKQIFAEHRDGFKRVYPRYDRRYYDGLVYKMLGCGDPEKMGYIEYRCLQSQHKPLAEPTEVEWDSPIAAYPLVPLMGPYSALYGKCRAWLCREAYVYRRASR
jgi:hypothetical protein